MRRSPADRHVVAVKPLLAGVGVEPRGRLTWNVQSINRGLPRETRRRADAERQAVRHSQADGVGGVRAGRGQQGRPRGGGETLAEFEADLENNLYKIWNRLSSGCYFPPPVRAVEIPKPHGGGTRVLGVPTVADRVAQTVVAMHLEERAEPRFHRDSYGYRPGKSALEAVGVCRRRCWENDWLIDLDVQKFFDEVPWILVVKAVEAVTDARWVLLYVTRWLARRCSTRMAPFKSETRGLRKGRRSRRSWRTCSCTTRSTPGWPGTSPAVRSNATPTMESCTA